MLSASASSFCGFDFLPHLLQMFLLEALAASRFRSCSRRHSLLAVLIFQFFLFVAQALVADFHPLLEVVLDAGRTVSSSRRRSRSPPAHTRVRVRFPRFECVLSSVSSPRGRRRSASPSFSRSAVNDCRAARSSPASKLDLAAPRRSSSNSRRRTACISSWARSEAVTATSALRRFLFVQRPLAIPGSKRCSSEAARSAATWASIWLRRAPRSFWSCACSERTISSRSRRRFSISSARRQPAFFLPGAYCVCWMAIRSISSSRSTTDPMARPRSDPIWSPSPRTSRSCSSRSLTRDSHASILSLRAASHAQALGLAAETSPLRIPAPTDARYAIPGPAVHAARAAPTPAVRALRAPCADERQSDPSGGAPLPHAAKTAETMPRPARRPPALIAEVPSHRHDRPNGVPERRVRVRARARDRCAAV